MELHETFHWEWRSSTLRPPRGHCDTLHGACVPSEHGEAGVPASVIVVRAVATTIIFTEACKIDFLMCAQETPQT